MIYNHRGKTYFIWIFINLSFHITCTFSVNCSYLWVMSVVVATTVGSINWPDLTFMTSTCDWWVEMSFWIICTKGQIKVIKHTRNISTLLTLNTNLSSNDKKITQISKIYMIIRIFLLPIYHLFTNFFVSNTLNFSSCDFFSASSGCRQESALTFASVSDIQEVNWSLARSKFPQWESVDSSSVLESLRATFNFSYSDLDASISFLRIFVPVALVFGMVLSPLSMTDLSLLWPWSKDDCKSWNQWWQRKNIKIVIYL